MKKILESYKKDQSNLGNRNMAQQTAKVAKAKDEMTPLQWLRHFWKNDLKIEIDLEKISFGRQKSFPR